MPCRNRYRETHGLSTFHDLRARRLMLRYRDGEGKTRYCHTLNNTLVASPRIRIPLLELNQEPHGRCACRRCCAPTWARTTSRGGSDGEAIGRCKTKHRIDIVISLRKNMDLFIDAVGLGRTEDAAWKEAH